jgi:hypothetical protein
MTHDAAVTESESLPRPLHWRVCALVASLVRIADDAQINHSGSEDRGGLPRSLAMACPRSVSSRDVGRGFPMAQSESDGCRHEG